MKAKRWQRPCSSSHSQSSGLAQQCSGSAPLTAVWPAQVGCNKVYTSTSDVMTHENFHKKNTQLINDGFQRFRATEDCGTADCQFYGQKTTHFHCR